MTLSKDTKILIVGLGLIGGSYAMALTKKGYKVHAITKDQPSIDYAVNKGIIASGTTTIDPDLISSSDLVIFALYPQVFIDWVTKNQHLLKSGAVITDVTGVKCGVVDAVQSILRKDIEFIPAHPMAGRECYGVENADDSIFKNANYIVTPTDKNTEEATLLCEDLGRILGFARISRLSPEEHDDMIAFLSQLTHVIAVSLMNSSDNENLVSYTGDSFRDLTRIAKINENMWSELFLRNKEALLKHIDTFDATLKAFRNMLASDDAEGMKEAMRKSTEHRKLFDK